MDQNNTPPPLPPTISYPAMATTSGSSFASSSSSRPPVRGPTPSSMLALSSSAAHSHRRFYPYPPPASLPATGSGSGSSSRLRQYIPPPSRKPPRVGRQRSTNALPSSFLSELLSIRTVSANLFASLNLGGTRPTTTQISATPHGQQAWPPSSSMSSRLGSTPPPTGSFSEFAQPVPSTGMPPMTNTSPSFSGSVSPYLSSSIVAPMPDGAFSGFRSPAALQPQAQAQQSLVSDPPSDLMWLTSGNDGVMQQASNSELVASQPTPVFHQVKEEPIDDAPCIEQQPMFISLDDDNDDDDGLSAILRSFKSSSEPPILPGLEPPVSSEDRLQLGAGSSSSSSRPCAWDANTVEGSKLQSLEAAMTPRMIMYDKVKTGESSSGGGHSIPWNCDSSMSMTQHLEPSQNNTLSALFQQQQPNPNLQMPLLPSSQVWQQVNSSDGGTSMLSQHQAVQPQWQPTQNNTFVQQQSNNIQLPLLPSLTDRLQLNNSSSGGSNPWNCHKSMSVSEAYQQAPQLDELFSSGFCDATPQWQSSSPNNTFTGLIQQQQNLQMPLLPSFTDNLQLNSTDVPGTCSGAGTNSSGQGWEVMPAPTAVASKFDISIAEGNMATSQPAMLPTPCNNYSVFGTSGSSSTSVWASMPLNLSYSSMEYSNALTNLRLDGMEKPSRLPPWQPSSLKVGAGASSSTSWRGAHGDFFSEVEMEAINKDKHLKKIVSTNPQRVERILSNQVSLSKLNTRKINRALDIQRRSEALQMDSMLLSTQVLSHKATTANYAQNNEMGYELQILNEQASLNEALSGQLKSEIQSSRLLQLNTLFANSIHNPMRNQMAGQNGSCGYGLCPLENSNINSSGLHQLPTHVQPTQHEQQPHQGIDDEFVMDQQQKPWNF